MLKIFYLLLLFPLALSFPFLNITVLNYDDSVLAEDVTFVPPKEEILLDDVKLFQRVSDDGILYEDDDEGKEQIISNTEEEPVEIILDDGSVRFFSKISENGMLYDELTPGSEVNYEAENSGEELEAVQIYDESEEIEQDDKN